MVVEVPVFFCEGKTPLKVEVQIRTIAMDFWASLEHQLKYKKEINNATEITEKLKESASTIAGLDIQMQQIRKDIEEHNRAHENDED